MPIAVELLAPAWHAVCLGRELTFYEMRRTSLLPSLHTVLFGLKILIGHREACACFAVIIVVVALVCAPVDAAPVPVRFLEGVTHGFLLVRSLAGETIGQGE